MRREVRERDRIALLLVLAGLRVIVGVVLAQPCIDRAHLRIGIRLGGELRGDFRHSAIDALTERSLKLRQGRALGQHDAAIVRLAAGVKAQDGVGIDPVDPEDARVIRLDHAGERLMPAVPLSLLLRGIAQRVGHVVRPRRPVLGRKLLIVRLIRGEPRVPLQRQRRHAAQEHRQSQKKSRRLFHGNASFSFVYLQLLYRIRRRVSIVNSQAETRKERPLPESPLPFLWNYLPKYRLSRPSNALPWRASSTISPRVQPDWMQLSSCPPIL